MTLDIFLENERLDIDDASSLAITYNFSDLTNPTTQTGDYSTTFTIKGTQHNNAIFGQIWRLDRVTLFGGEFNTSVHFNASKRTNCVIYINHDVFKRGYLKLNTIKSAKGVISYEVTFYSEMVDVLRTLKESKLRDLPFPNDLRHTLNAATIRQAWEVGGKQGIFYYLAYIMANNGLYEEFESGKWLTGSYDNYQVSDILPSGIQLDECAKREYRSYYQRPALRLKGLIDLIAEQHGIQLDPAFFNDSNPYYANGVMALPQYNIMEQNAQQKGIATYPMPNSITYTLSGQSNTVTPTYRADGDAGIFGDTSSPTLNLADVLSWSLLPVVEFEYRIIANMATSVPVGTRLKWVDKARVTPRVRIDTNTGTQIVFNMDKIATSENIAQNIQFTATGGNNNTLAYGYLDTKGAYLNYTPNGALWSQWIPIHAILDESVVNLNYTSGTVKLFIEQGPLGQPFYLSQVEGTKLYKVSSFTIEFRPITKVPSTGGNLNNYYPAAAGFFGVDFSMELTKKIRSGFAVDKRDIIDDETTQGDFLINYAKLFGLLFYTDKDGTPHLVTRNTFFKDYKVEDWTQKIDHAKEIQQVPIPFDSKYLSLRYQNGDTFYEDYYKHQYELEYGEQRISTGFDFAENETELIAEPLFYDTVMSKESTRVLLKDGTLYEMKFQQDTKMLPALFQKEDNQRTPSDTKFNLLFDNGLYIFAESGKPADIPVNKRIWLTDDYEGMIKAEGGGQVCWIDTENYIVSNYGGVEHKLIPELYYPQFSTLHKDSVFSWHLGYPLENYAGWMRSDFPESSTIYANFWRNYITEIYDVDNRIMTAYVRLTAADIAQFSFANFVKIGDALWHVNKIEQFDPLGNGTTKVEFLRVSSLAAIENAYKNGQTDMSAIVPPEPERYDVVLQLTHITSSTDDTNVEEGEMFTAILDADTGYRIDSIVITMGTTDITSQTIGGVKVWQPNANNSGGTITIAGVTGEVNIVASAVQVQPDNYRTIKVYSDIEDAIIESNGVRYTHLSMDTPAEVKVYWGDGVTDGITIDYSQAGNLPGTPVLIYGLPKPRGSAIEIWDMVVTPSRIDSSGEFYEYDDTDGDMEFMEGKTYVITALPAIGEAKGIVVQGLIGQSISSYNGRTWTTLFNNTTADSVNMEIPADSVAIQFWNMGDRDILNVDNVMFAFYGLGTGIAVPAAYLKDKNNIYIDYDHV